MLVLYPILSSIRAQKMTLCCKSIWLTVRCCDVELEAKQSLLSMSLRQDACGPVQWRVAADIVD